MRIAVSSTGNSLDSQVDPRFGRCQIVLVVDTETLKVEALSNTSIGQIYELETPSNHLLAKDV